MFSAACGTGDVPERLLAVDGFGGQYELAEVQIPELLDPRRMRGELGDGSVGGFLDEEDGRLILRGGGPVVVDYAVRDGVGVPFDGDGVLLWSYYNHLSSARAELESLGISVDALFPVDFVFQPSVAGVTQVATNAAYAAGGAHKFVLLADTVRANLPLAANPVVIRHELGHAFFQNEVAGGVDVYDEQIFVEPRLAALQEGFADSVATLLLDDPDVLGASLPSVAAARDVRGDLTLATALPVEEDFYSRGTVYASFAWDLRELSTPEFALQAVVGGLRAWSDRAAFREDPSALAVDRYARFVLVEALDADPSLETPLCRSFLERFPGLAGPCS